MKGLTLIETLISIAILVLVLAAITVFVLNNYQLYYFNLKQSTATEEAKRGVETMVKEIRKARRGEDGSYVIAGAEDFQFIFYSDVDKDDDVEKVRYFVEEGKFKKGVIEPSGIPASYPGEDEQISILSNWVVNTPPIFRYFDGDGQELPYPTRKRETKLMRLTLEIDVNPGEAPPAFTLISETQIRNLKTN